jgi:hypothetical protein
MGSANLFPISKVLLSRTKLNSLRELHFWKLSQQVRIRSNQAQSESSVQFVSIRKRQKGAFWEPAVTHANHR